LAAFTGCGGALGGGGDGGGDEAAKADSGSAADTGAARTTAQAGAADEEVMDFSAAPSGKLTISAFDTMTYKSGLEAAAQAFNEKYPDIEIVVDTFTAMPEIQRQESADGRSVSMAMRMEDNPQERSDYANKVNTALMSGEGADILAVDVIPVAKYVESGLLVDLSPYMERDPGFDRSQYRVNILDAVTWKGGTWFIPMDYMYNYFSYDTSLITDGSADFNENSAYTIEQLMDYAIPLFDGETMLLNVPAYTKGLGGSAWSRILREHWSEFVDISGKRANFNDGKFAELLKKVKEYGENGYIPESVQGRFDREDTMSRMMQAPTDRYYFKPKSNMQLLTYYMSAMGGGINIGYAVGSAGAIEEDDEIAGISSNADGTVPFTYSMAYAINSNSKNKQAAWEFIKFMMSGEMQASGYSGMLRGLPLHNETRASQIDIMMASAAAGIRGNAPLGGTSFFGRSIPGGGTANSGPGGGAVSGDGAAPVRQTDDGAAPVKQADDGAAPVKQADDGAAPVRQAAPDGQADDGVASGDGGAAADGPLLRGPGTALAEIDPEIIKQYNEATERFSDQINTFEIKDSIVDDMIAAEVDYFFSGEKTAEEVAATLQSKVELYLNE